MTKIDSPARVAITVAVAVLLNALVLLGFSELLGSFTLDGPGAALGTALALGLVNRRAALATGLLIWFFSIGEEGESAEGPIASLCGSHDR